MSTGTIILMLATLIAGAVGFALGWIARTGQALRDRDCFNLDHKEQNERHYEHE